METFDLLQRFSVAMAIGLLLGLERGWQARQERDGERAAGLRTHALSAILGAVWGAVAKSLGDGGAIALGLAFSAFSAAIIAFRFRETTHDGTFGTTTVIAAMLAFVLGAFAVLGDVQVAGATGVAVVGLLALKATLHSWINRISWIELRSGLVLLAMTFILLPLLPNRTVDLWAVINPFEVWLMTVMIAVISFVGYVSMKLVGDRGGVLITGVAGGLASSTAVTLTMARLARDYPEQRDTLLAGTLIAGATMMVRVLVIVGFVNASLLPRLAVPIGLASLAQVGTGLFLFWKPATADFSARRIVLKNPFDLSTVLMFASVLIVVTVLAKVVTSAVGNSGAYALAAVSGIADVDAITLSMASLGAGSLDGDVAARAIAIVVAVNTLAKAFLGWATGGLQVGWRLAAAAGVTITAGLLGYLLAPSP